MTGEIFSDHLTWIVIAIAFIGSLFACKGIVDRFWFTVSMPIIYSLIFALFFLSIGAIFGNFLPAINSDSLEILAIAIDIAIAGTASLAIFVVQVYSMAGDPVGGPRGYSITAPRRRSIGAQAVNLQRLPTRKRWSG